MDSENIKDYVHLLNIVKKEQEKQGVSDYRLAKLSNVNKSTISRIMSGETVPSVLVFIAMQKALNLNLLEPS